MIENISNRPKVSIIIPVYNVEKYLDKCVTSVLAQTLSDIEIILVDDGPTDRSGEMCDKYLNDQRVKVIHKKNGGLSDARNKGIEASTADYIGFIDSDDYIELDMFELLYSNIRKYDADVSFCGMYNVYANGPKPAYVTTTGQFVVDAKRAIELVLGGEYASVSAVNKLYKKECLGNHRFLYGKTSEDAHFMVPFLTRIKRGVIDMSPKYYYVHREGTITTRPFKRSDLSIIEAYTNNKKIVDEMYPELSEIAAFRCFWAHFYVLDKMIRTDSYGNNGEYKTIVSEIKRNYFKIIRNKYVGRGRKIAVTGLLLSKKIYAQFLTAYDKKNREYQKD